ncbi:MAG: endo-1,4-beta-xylanase [Planctomycetaceae bacterium]
MGLIQFSIQTDQLVTPSEVAKADFVTFDGRVIPATSTLDARSLSCIRRQTDSSKLRVLCDLPDRQLVAQTTSLREALQPYPLELELARGELTRLRNFHSLWTGAGLKSNPELEERIRKAHASFRQAVFADQRSGPAIETIAHTQAAMDLLVSEYSHQRINFRHQKMQKFPLFVGCRLAQIPQHPETFLDAFNAVLIRTRWQDLEPGDGNYQWDTLEALVDWAMDSGLFCIGGPLLDLSADCFPEWMSAWKHDLRNLESYTVDFIETVVGKFVGRIRHWEVVCGGNRGGSNGLTEEQRLNLVLRAIDAAQKVDEQIQISLRIVQPWGEYLSCTDNRLAPIQFVDTIRRSGVSIAEVNLDLRFGNQELNSLQRDLLNVSQLLDHWSLLQLPLNVMVAIPETSFEPLISDPEALVSWQTQQLEDLLLLCLAKERLSGFYCLNWEDRRAADHPLVDMHGTVHPVVRKFVEFEDRHWTRND